jgi:hypothetical protein
MIDERGAEVFDMPFPSASLHGFPVPGEFPTAIGARRDRKSESRHPQSPAFLIGRRVWMSDN